MTRFEFPETFTLGPISSVLKGKFGLQNYLKFGTQLTQRCLSYPNFVNREELLNLYFMAKVEGLYLLKIQALIVTLEFELN